MSEKKIEKKLRVFISSNAPWSMSGYGQQMAELVPQIQESGYPLALCNFYGQEGGILNLNGVTHYPRYNHVYGSDSLVTHAKDFAADVSFTLQDIWVLHPQDIQGATRWIPIVPIDHDPVPEPILERLKMAYRIVTYSKFGQEELQKRGLHSTYIQHTVDTNVFTPMDKAERKKEAGIPDNSYLVGMVSANKDNPPRKSFQEAMDAFKMFLKDVPNAYLYLHTNPDQPGGFPIKQYGAFIGIIDRLLFPDNYQMNFKYGKPEMAKIYNTFDMLLCPSTNEGFGVPIIEAQACGVPVVTNNFTAMPELIKNHITGELCEVGSLRYDQLGSYIAIPSTKSIYDCMTRIYKTNKDNLMGKAARTFMVEEYDTKKVFKEKWAPFLEKLSKEVYNT